jgi:hypothetical protein
MNCNICGQLTDDEANLCHYCDYLNRLRESAVTNMFGAVPYLEAEFGLTRTEATPILTKWMRGYHEM